MILFASIFFRIFVFMFIKEGDPYLRTFDRPLPGFEIRVIVTSWKEIANSLCFQFLGMIW